MAEYRLLLPAMGEGVMEATIIEWLYKEGDYVNEDDSVVEIATDKVDSDVPMPISGRLVKILKQKNEIAKIGENIAIFEINNDESTTDTQLETAEDYKILSNIEEKIENLGENSNENVVQDVEPNVEKELLKPIETNELNSFSDYEAEAYLSPLVKSIIERENISDTELQFVRGSGSEGRITKDDILDYLSNRDRTSDTTFTEELVEAEALPEPPVFPSSMEDDIVPMDRMRKIIAENMLKSKQISAHVTSFIETDVTNLVNWRNTHKIEFEKREGEKLTFMPLFIKAVIKAIQEFPMINISVDGSNIIKKKNINIGMATATPDGNLIVPVIKNADKLSLSGLAKAVNDLAHRARNKQLKPDETVGATYTISNIGSFGNLMGTPIIPQPQVAILAIGAIVKKPSVLETPEGDVIAIRNMMFMSHSYDHRIIDGALGGMFLKYVSDYLQSWNKKIHE